MHRCTLITRSRTSTLTSLHPQTCCENKLTDCSTEPAQKRIKRLNNTNHPQLVNNQKKPREGDGKVGAYKVPRQNAVQKLYPTNNYQKDHKCVKKKCSLRCFCKVSSPDMLDDFANGSAGGECWRWCSCCCCCCCCGRRGTAGGTWPGLGRLLPFGDHCIGSDGGVVLGWNRELGRWTLT